eukprot:2134286-Karenia_brevis.AAC.1
MKPPLSYCTYAQQLMQLLHSELAFDGMVIQDKQQKPDIFNKSAKMDHAGGKGNWGKNKP